MPYSRCHIVRHNEQNVILMHHGRHLWCVRRASGSVIAPRYTWMEDLLLRDELVHRTIEFVL